MSGMADDETIYLDNNATTQLNPAVVEEMLPFLTKYYGNPSSGYGFAAKARKAVDLARERLAALLGCESPEIVFTSGGTESNNTAIASSLQFEPRGKHVVTSAVEHSAVLRPCQDLTKRGCEVAFLAVDRDGNVDLDEAEAVVLGQPRQSRLLQGNVVVVVEVVQPQNIVTAREQPLRDMHPDESRRSCDPDFQ